ncbi:sensor domain-containing diguanylate cyclase [Aeromicrobium endophyticum]|uniref:GGDEF domain-containing protein n=1 Tax=Aeromicrobium endophyticum TaxID=2292704 RepID=A0A371PBB2_9ACTN|nr:GGDEF domain-containing protein [Aeromicrobium endophyticum]REK72856.1 GGDEF domain-containing protein [Aeromicrobium endophyticum]
MELMLSRLVTSLRELPPLTAATAAMYGSGAVLLLAGAATWEPGKNPRWVITSLAVLATAMFVWTLARGSRFTPREALAMTVVQLFVVGCLTWTTHLMLGAFANGTVLPIAGVYVIWFLHPVAGRVVLYLGASWWIVAIVHHERASLVTFAASVVAQTVVATEVFARIKQRMDRVARTDPLTGTLNRRGITEVLQRELERAQRRDRPISVVAIDIDGLREVNNTRGHRAGDEMLASVSRHWIEGVRRHDAIGRTGGDEFLLVLPGTSLEQARAIVRRLIDESPGRWSAGVAMAKPQDSAESMLDRADTRLYEAKSARQGV